MANAEQINKNKNWKCVKMIDGYKPEKVNRNITQCRVCANEKGMCHDGCAFKSDKDKVKCIAMDETGHCKVCIGKHAWH